MPLFKKKKKSASKPSTPKKKKGIKKIFKGLGWKLLLPYKPFMLTALHKKGVPTPDHDTEKVARSFYQHILKGNNYEGFDYENLDPITMSVVIKAVLEFIKGLKKKKEEGKPLTQEEEKILEKANEISEVVEDNVKEEASLNIGNLIMEYWWILALVVLYLLMRDKN